MEVLYAQTNHNEISLDKQKHPNMDTTIFKPYSKLKGKYFGIFNDKGISILNELELLQITGKSNLENALKVFKECKIVTKEF